MDFPKLFHRLHDISEPERRVLAHLLDRQSISQDTNQAFEQRLTLGERVADRVATFGGSWTFIGSFLAAMGECRGVPPEYWPVTVDRQVRR